MHETSVMALPGVSRQNAWADWAGMIASIGCAIHCAAMPLVLAYLPALGLDWLTHAGFHQWMALLCCVLATWAFVPGWRRHRSLLPALWGAAGLLLLMLAAFGMKTTGCSACSSCSACANQAATLATTQPGGNDASALHQSTPPTQPARSIAFWMPWVTPLGGVLLVLGYLINHSKSCLCRGNQCCLTTNAEQQASAHEALHSFSKNGTSPHPGVPPSAAAAGHGQPRAGIGV